LSIRWLHVSDVHERLRDDVHRVGMYDAIVQNVIERREKPNLLFFTGDLAFSGAPDQYELLKERFLDPLREVLPADCPILTVPGNHDVDRKRGVNPRIWMADPEEQRVFQQVDAEGRQKRADMILPRLEGYRALEQSLGAWDEDWLASDRGMAFTVREIGGRRLAIIGMNTAWLCHNDDDWGRLAVGRTMLDAALNAARSAAADLTIVLGHHPIAALMGELEWSDGERVRQRLQQANAIYLHGHLHKAGAQRTGDAMESLLAIQAPSGFQAGDDKIWRNGILWGELDFDQGLLIIEPLKWNDDHNEYVFDIEAAPGRYRVTGRDAFAYGLPGREPASAAPGGSPLPLPAVRLPEGWQIIDAAQLAEITASRPSVEEMADWFDGSFPRWEVAVAEGVRPRQIVDDLVRTFEAAHHTAPQPLARLLTGAGGEGKSAALLQTVARLLRGAQSWRCLWRQSAAADLPDDWPALMPRNQGQAWIVAIDDAENIGAGLPEALRKLGARTDVHLILAAREADWTLRGLHDTMWEGVANHRRLPLAGIDGEDARRITDGWEAWGPAAMGKLQGQTSESAALILLESARSLSANKEEGALLGALLMVREGEELRQRVNRLMTPWTMASGVDGRSLLDIYAAIVAMHAENQLYLSRTVLAYALDCDEAELDSGPLRILRREAMVDGGTAYVLTRHRRIAEVARDWLVENGYNVDQWYSVLAWAAHSEFKNRRSGNPDINRWQWDLARHFVECGASRWPVASAIAKALFNSDTSDPLLLTNYLSTLRRIGKAKDALALMHTHGPRFRRHRDVLYEWSVAAGAAGDYGLNVWLAARSLADDRSYSLDSKRCKLSLAGLGAAFRELAASTARREFLKAQAACGRLGLSLTDVDPKTRGFFKEDSEALPLGVNQAASPENDIATLKKLVVTASYETAPENDRGMDDLIGEPDAYRYQQLSAALSNTCRPRGNNER
jgi:predicted phosphodiesterase